MGNSTVKENDLENLNQFPHLKKLHLQNIAIGDEAIKQLRDLHYLESLNLSGTRISSKALEEISGWKNLKKLFLYNTQITEESVKVLKNTNPELQVFNTQFDLTDSVYNAQLTIPVCKIDSAFFRERAWVEIKLSRGSVKYYYTLDGTDPSSKTNLYKEPFQITRSGELKIVATMNGWIDSKVVTFPLLKLGAKPDRITLETKPDPKYSGKMDSTLVDGKSGSLNRGDKEYLGFSNQNFQVLFQMDKAKTMSGLALSFLEDVENGVLPPVLVELWGGEDKNRLTKLGEVKTDPPLETRAAAKRVLKIDFPQQSVSFLRVSAKKANALPAWQPKKKDIKASIFVDEVSLE